MSFRKISEWYPTYSATSTAFTPGATPQDVFTLTGSATADVFVTSLSLTTTQGTSGVNAWYVAKRSTANSGGTSAAPTIVPHLSTNAAATATVLQYTANPTAGTLVGYLLGAWLNSPKIDTSGIGGGPPSQMLDLLTFFAQPPGLLSASEVLAINFKGAALPSGLSVIAHVEWIEVPKS